MLLWDVYVTSGLWTDMLVRWFIVLLTCHIPSRLYLHNSHSDEERNRARQIHRVGGVFRKHVWHQVRICGYVQCMMVCVCVCVYAGELCMFILAVSLLIFQLICCVRWLLTRRSIPSWSLQVLLEVGRAHYSREYSPSIQTSLPSVSLVRCQLIRSLTLCKRKWLL